MCFAKYKMHRAQCEQCREYIVEFDQLPGALLYTVHCTLYIVQCTMYSAESTM